MTSVEMTSVEMQQVNLGHEAFEHVREVMESGNLTSSQYSGGKFTSLFEQKMAEYLESDYVVAVSSGTTALQLSLVAAGVGRGDEVFVPSYTFPATIHAVESVGARPVFVDIDPDTYTMNVKKCNEKITYRTKAIIPVHIHGHVADLGAIHDFVSGTDVRIIEDCAQSLGSKYVCNYTGTYSDFGCFSFYPSKIITCGEGGLIVTNNRYDYDRLRKLRNHGRDTIGVIDAFGVNARMSEIHAAIGYSQMLRLRYFLERRRSNSELFDWELFDIYDLHLPYPKFDSDIHNCNDYTVRVDGDDAEKKTKDIVLNLNNAGYNASRYYTNHYHKSEQYKHLNITLPVTEDIVTRTFSLPVHPGVVSSDISEMSKIIRSVME